MKKVGLAILLLAIVIGVGYLSALRNQSAEKSRYQEGYAKGLGELAAVKKEADSLRMTIQKQELVSSDSLKAFKTRYATQVDSLHRLLATKDSLLSVQRRGKVGGQSTRTVKNAPKPGTSKGDDLSHAQILEYYKRRLGQLPGDLSDYERKVAVNEIRTETAKKFSISIPDLDKLRQGNNTSE